MSAALIVRFRPVGPWRLGPDNGSRDRVDHVFHSDSLFSAITVSMRDLGWLDQWIDATVNTPSAAVRLSSCYPYAGRNLLVQPPRNVWPPAQTGKVRWKAARFVPLSLIPALLRGDELNPDQWAVEPLSGCLLPVERNAAPVAPFRIVQRATAPVDRLTGASEQAHATTCLQFGNGAGMWFVVSFTGESAREDWEIRVRSAARLLADSGLGGRRSQGWGRSLPPVFEKVDFPAFLLGGAGPNGGEKAWWMLSLFSPADTDPVDWSRGNYELVTRAGRIESMARWGELKLSSRMVAEGSVLLSGTPPAGTARNVAPAENPHPIYRSGLALAVPVAWHESRRLSWLATERPQPAPEPETAAAPVAIETPAEPEVPAEPEIPAEPEVQAVPAGSEAIAFEFEPEASPQATEPEPPPAVPPAAQEPSVEEPGQPSEGAEEIAPQVNGEEKQP